MRKEREIRKGGTTVYEDLFQSSLMVDFELTDDEKEDDDANSDPKRNGKPAKDDEDVEDRNGVLTKQKRMELL